MVVPPDVSVICARGARVRAAQIIKRPAASQSDFLAVAANAVCAACPIQPNPYYNLCQTQDLGTLGVVLMAKITALNVNGKKLKIDADSATSLLSVLRNDLDLTGSKYGCGEGECGACTVLVDGLPAKSCIMPVGRVAAREITTIEGLEQDGRLHPVQQAFLKADAMQCAYCTSGMIMAGVGLLSKNPHPNRDEIVKGMNGNVCRCGTYQRIVTAIQSVGK